MWGHGEKAAVFKSEREFSPETDPVDVLILDIWSPVLHKIKFCCLSYPVRSILLWQPEVTNSRNGGSIMGRDEIDPLIWTSTVPTFIQGTSFVNWWEASSVKRTQAVSIKAVPAGGHSSAHMAAAFIDALGAVSPKQIFSTEFCPTFEDDCYIA